jgi:hypothetical protein
MTKILNHEAAPFGNALARFLNMQPARLLRRLNNCAYASMMDKLISRKCRPGPP